MNPTFDESVRRLARIAFLLTTVLGGSAAVSAAEGPCQVIRFKPGTSSAQIVGTVHPEQPLPCYRFTTGNGQTVRLTVESDYDSIGFTIDGLVDNRLDYMFQSQKKTYEFNVHQTLKAVEPRDYRLTLSIR